MTKVCIYTNGTVVPSDKQDELLKSPKVFSLLQTMGS